MFGNVPLTIQPTQDVDKLMLVEARFMMSAGVVGYTPSGNDIFADASIEHGSEESRLKNVITTGSVVYVGSKEEPKVVLWIEVATQLSTVMEDSSASADPSPPIVTLKQ